jgi:hypothetical protein
VDTGTGRLFEMGVNRSRIRRYVAAGVMALALPWLSAAHAGPVETNVFAVQGVSVDITSTDAAAAKNEALMDVQVKAFFELAARLGSPELAQTFEEKFKPEDIAPYLRSLSIEQESSAPGRYIGTFTVRFLPEKTRKLFESYGVKVPTVQADPILVLPVWRGPAANQLWEDNLWRKAWLDLKGEQGLVPVIIPLGDLEDTETLTVEDALHNDPVKLEAIRRRYDAPSILVAQAEPADGGIHVYIEGETKLGKVLFNKIYKSENGEAATAAPVAIQKFQSLLVDAYKERLVVAEDEARNANRPRALAIAVPFSSPREWNAIRSRILSAPNVVGVDLSTLSADGAVIKLNYTRNLPALQNSMQQVGLTLSQYGSTWVIQPM